MSGLNALKPVLVSPTRNIDCNRSKPMAEDISETMARLHEAMKAEKAERAKEEAILASMSRGWSGLKRA